MTTLLMSVLLYTYCPETGAVTFVTRRTPSDTSAYPFAHYLPSTIDTIGTQKQEMTVVTDMLNKITKHACLLGVESTVMLVPVGSNTRGRMCRVALVYYRNTTLVVADTDTYTTVTADCMSMGSAGLMRMLARTQCIPTAATAANASAMSVLDANVVVAEKLYGMMCDCVGTPIYSEFTRNLPYGVVIGGQV